ncbi:hypothetical protein A9Q84_11255 [Halobacteriovorax marinus]|uniref:Uncharacterized protein n=1 Tax=Halobacteriovorax marinus TaxID=97084 RepID=A0A1Y5F7K7_9BACT|nr:hypothetical protein A9Q84_11255 [Halobacteriovorax marinus]
MKKSLTLSAFILVLSSMPAMAEFNSSLLLNEDIKKSIGNLPRAISKLENQSKRVTYFKKREFEKFCDNLFAIDAITSTIDNDARKLKREMTGAHRKSYNTVNKSLKKLTNSVHYSLSNARVECSINTRMKAKVAKNIVNFDKVETEFKAASKQYKKSINMHIKLYQAFGVTDISDLSGFYKGRTPILDGYKKCSVNIVVKQDKIKTILSVRGVAKKRLTRDVTDFVNSEDKFRLHDFNFNQDLETSALCSKNVVSKLSIDLKNRSVSKVTVGVKRNANVGGYASLVQCFQTIDADLDETTCNIK